MDYGKTGISEIQFIVIYRSIGKLFDFENNLLDKFHVEAASFEPIDNMKLFIVLKL
jgi:hypothetical protein